MISLGYVRFRLKLNLEAILEGKAILLQKICLGHQNGRIALGLGVVHMATLGSNQSERSKICLDQSESRISPM